MQTSNGALFHLEAATSSIITFLVREKIASCKKLVDSTASAVHKNETMDMFKRFLCNVNLSCLAQFLCIFVNAAAVVGKSNLFLSFPFALTFLRLWSSEWSTVYNGERKSKISLASYYFSFYLYRTHFPSTLKP